MMKEFIVAWSVIVNAPAPCPDYKPNPYTGEYPSSHCLVYHTQREVKQMQESFKTRKEAEAFIAEAPKTIKPNMKILEVK